MLGSKQTVNKEIYDSMFKEYVLILLSYFISQLIFLSEMLTIFNLSECCRVKLLNISFKNFKIKIYNGKCKK